MFPFRIVCALCFSIVSVSVDTSQLHLLSDEFINKINAKQNSWKAGRNFPAHTSIASLKKLMGAWKDSKLSLEFNEKLHGFVLRSSLPKKFDPRKKWPNCPSLQKTADQGFCGSCWAFGAVQSMTDRVCIYSNATQHFHFSVEDLISCCSTCGDGCNGGDITRAWDYWKDVGIVSGGNYNTSEGCKPYVSYNITACDDEVPEDDMICTHNNTLKCHKKCREDYNITYKKDKRYGKNVYSIRGEDNIKAELFENGPVEGALTVYSDLLTYKTGVYQQTEGKPLGEHAVKIMGWGVEKGNKYWLVANSWSKVWGDNGFFKILRGVNHCGIESSIIAGDPLLS